MVLHTTFAGLKLASSGGTTYDTVSSTGFFPSGDAEIQMRGGGLPRLIGIDNMSSEIVQIGATTDYDHFNIRLNTWTNADYYHRHVMKTTNGAAAKYGNFVGDGQPHWFPGIQLDQDADWDVRVNSTTASMSVVCALYLSYGGMLPYKGGQIVSRSVALASDDGAYPGFGTAATITDLDPRVTYRVAGIQLANVEDHDHIGVAVTSPSNNTYVGAVTGAWTATTFHVNSIPVWFPHDSILISGTETVSLYSFSDVAQKPTFTVFFEKYGSSGTAQASPMASFGTGLGAPAVTGGGASFLNLGRFLTRP
jgi:hypothetical protein